MKNCFKLFSLYFIFLTISCSDKDDILQVPEEEQTEEKAETENEEQPEDDTENIEPAVISNGLIANDMDAHPMQDIAKPGYLQTIIDPSFGTTIRRISNAGAGNIIKPMYSTIQAWNTDETYMILYDQKNGVHQLLDGMNYSFIRNLDDISPSDIEQIYWDFNVPDIFYYVDNSSKDFIKYSVSSREKNTITNLVEISGCTGGLSSGNDVQMMSWDSDVIGFRCDNSEAFYYRISTNEVTSLIINDINYTAAMPAASGSLFYHGQSVYDTSGNALRNINESGTEHSCLGKLIGGNDAHYTVAFEAGPQGGCQGNIIAHDLTTGECFPVISEEQGYAYPKSGTHISAVAHNNPGWIAASMVGYEEDGKTLLDQELVLARVEKNNVKVYRIGHHRADENQFDYWGEPHAVISPNGTRVLFGSDWSGTDDGHSVDSYVVELPGFTN